MANDKQEEGLIQEKEDKIGDFTLISHHPTLILNITDIPLRYHLGLNLISRFWSPACEEGQGVCAYLMVVISVVLIFATFPFSLCLVVKVVQVCLDKNKLCVEMCEDNVKNQKCDGP